MQRHRGTVRVILNPATEVSGRLADRVAVVTGSSRSLGRSIAIGFAQQGAAVVVNYVSDKLAAEAVVEAIEDIGGNAVAVQADTSVATDVERLIDSCIQSYGKIDILVNNAAVLRRTPFLDITEEEWDWIMSINLNG